MADFIAAIMVLGLFILIFVGPPTLIILLIVRLVGKSKKKKDAQQAKNN